MKKIALCLYGYFGNINDKNAGYKGRTHIEERILSKSNCDIFIHSWQPELEDVILKTHPETKSFIFEKQIDFQEICDKYNISQGYFDEGFNRSKTQYKQCKITSSLSFFYSRSKSLELKKTYEENNNFIYDWVIVGRFDLGWRMPKPHMGYTVSRILFDPDLNNKFIYSAMWNQLNAGYADQWFYSNSKNMDILGSMYDKSLEYFQPGSKFEKTLTTAWPDSAHQSTGPKHLWTNEILKSDYEKSKKLYQYPKWQVVNNHILHKWFFIDVGLYDKTKFVVG